MLHPNNTMEYLPDQPDQPDQNISRIQKAMFNYMLETVALVEKNNKKYNRSCTLHFLMHDITAPESKVGVFFSFLENEKEWGSDKAIVINQRKIYINNYNAVEQTFSNEMRPTNNKNPFNLFKKYSLKKGREFWNICVNGEYTGHAMKMPVFEPDQIENYSKQMQGESQ